jgi:hypothetical protein
MPARVADRKLTHEANLSVQVKQAGCAREAAVP